MNGTCECGCETPVAPDSRGRPRRFVHGHNQRGRRNPSRARPESTNPRTCRARAHSLIGEACELERIGGCSPAGSRLEVHHRDGDYTNNDESNLMTLCKSHHALVERGRVDPDDPVMPAYRVDGAGKRRYRYL